MAFLDKSHTVAAPGYNRWLIPPARCRLSNLVDSARAYEGSSL